MPNSSTALTSSGVGRNRTSVVVVVVVVVIVLGVADEDVASMNLAIPSSSSSSSLSETIAELFISSVLSAPKPSGSTADDSVATAAAAAAVVVVLSSPIDGAGEDLGVGVKSLSEMITGSSSSDIGNGLSGAVSSRIMLQ